MSELYRVTTAALNVRSVPSTLNNTPIASMPQGTLFHRLSLSADGLWQRIGVELESLGQSIEGWCSSSTAYSEPAPAPAPAPAPVAGLSAARFNAAARQKYIDSILKESNGGPGHRYNFFRKSRQNWVGTPKAWVHGYKGDDGKLYEVGIDWFASKDGAFTVTKPTQSITEAHYNTTYPQFDAEGDPINESTYCNFNVSFCYQQAYGGQNLQDTNGRTAGGELSANGLVDWLAANWKQVPAATAARIANQGGFVVAGKKEVGKSGHVAFLVEGSDETGTLNKLRCFNVGGSLPKVTVISTGAWNSTDALAVRYFVDPATHAEWTAAVGA